jgi:hypothetical protein
LTNLPASDDAFLTGKAEVAPTMKDVLAGDIANLSPLGSVALMSCIFGLNLTHLHRPDSQDRENDVNGEFWKRHRAYDNILLNISLSLPNSLRLPRGITNPNIIFANMSIHTSTICLHQAAIFKAEKNKLQNQIAAESKRRCIIAADQVASIMRMISHTDLSTVSSRLDTLIGLLGRLTAFIDESFLCFLPLRCCSSLCAILEITTRRPGCQIFVAFPAYGFECAEAVQLSYRILFDSARR